MQRAGGATREPRPGPDRDLGAGNTRRIRTLLTTARRVINKALQNAWETIWRQGKHGRYLHSLHIGPDKKTLKTYQDLLHTISSIIIQMRTGKIGLRAYLYSINKAGQRMCENGDQTVEHILLKCREWVVERHELWAGRRPILNLRRVLGDPMTQ